jgi:hypothetical protein
MNPLKNELACGPKGNGDNGGVVSENFLRVTMGVNEVVSIAVFVDENTVEMKGVSFELRNDIAYVFLNGILGVCLEIKKPFVIGDGIPAVIVVLPFVAEHLVVMMMPTL